MTSDDDALKGEPHSGAVEPDGGTSGAAVDRPSGAGAEPEEALESMEEPDQPGEIVVGESEPGDGGPDESEPEAEGSHAVDSAAADAPTPPAPQTKFRRFDCTNGDASELFRASDAARQAIGRGECIVLPTDTVYGIGADAFNSAAVQGLLDAKLRGRDMPPPVLIADPSLIRVLAVDVPAAAKDLIDRHWPGPLTVICQAQPSLRLDLGEAEGTIALRVPDHPLAREILRQTGPMAVSSANRSGQPAAVTCDEAVAQLGDEVAVYLDGGRLGDRGAAPSTIVDFTKSENGAVLRHGVLSIKVLRETCPDLQDHSPNAADVGDESADPAPVAHAADDEDADHNAFAAPDRAPHDHSASDAHDSDDSAGDEPDGEIPDGDWSHGDHPDDVVTDEPPVRPHGSHALGGEPSPGA